jgi:hypothetical protein
MNHETCPRGGRRGGIASRRPLTLAALLCPLLLAGCGSTSLGGATNAAAPAAPPAPTDPLVAFAAQATPGTESRVVLLDGSPALVRMTRSYAAASGRECRELLVGSGMAQRVQLVCSGEDGAWNTARPLLPGAGAVRR